MEYDLVFGKRVAVEAFCGWERQWADGGSGESVELNSFDIVLCMGQECCICTTTRTQPRCVDQTRRLYTLFWNQDAVQKYIPDYPLSKELHNYLIRCGFRPRGSSVGN